MKNGRRICRVLSACICFLAAVFCFVSARAGEAGGCTLCIEYMDETTPIEGAGFRVYRAADLLEHGEYSITEPFADCGAVLKSQMTNSEWEEAAAMLADCVALHSIEPYAGGQTGSDGTLLLHGLPEGLYLVEGDNVNKQKRMLQSQVFCAVLPGRSADGSPEYYVTATPKYESIALSPRIVIEKEQSLNEGSLTKNRLTAQAYDVVTYYLTVRNTGDADATDVTVTDAVPKGLYLKEGSNAISDGGTADNGVVTWHLGTMAANTSRRVSFQAVVPRVEEYTLWKNMASVDYEENDGPPEDSNIVEVEEEPVEETETGSITVTKRLIYGDTPLAADNESFYAALYADEERTMRVTDVAELHFSMSSCESAVFTGLEPGRAYYVGETDAQGKAVSVGRSADGTPYMAVYGESSGAVLENADETLELEFQNEFMGFPEGYSYEGTLTVVKQVLDEDGQPQESDETFYAGIFADEALTVFSDLVSENIVEIPMGGEARMSVYVNTYCAKDEVLKLYVAEVTPDGTPVDDGFAYAASVDAGEPEFGMDIVENTVTITNQVREETYTEEETEVQTEQLTERPTDSQTGEPVAGSPTSEAVRTGDDTPVASYLLLLMASALAAAAAAFGRKHSLRDK